jgi:tetratricopeptide (TPR) repeat protein
MSNRVYDWKWSSAEGDFLRSIELNPNYRNAHGMYAEYLDSMGRFAEAEKERTISMQLSPLEPIIYANAAEHLTYTRDYDRAIENWNASRKPYSPDRGHVARRRS